MALSDIILQKGQVIVLPGISGSGVFPIDPNLGFGVVQYACSTSDKTTAGSYVMYDKRNGKQLMYGSTIYMLIDEQHITGSEVIP